MVTSRKRLAAAMLASCSIAVAASACSTDSEMKRSDGSVCENTYTIGFSHPVSEAAFVSGLKKSIDNAAAQEGCVEVLYDRTTANNLETQRSTIESWVTQSVDAIVVLPVDEAALEGLRTQAQANGIKWITYGSKLENADGSAGFDNVASGQLVANWIGESVVPNVPAGRVTAMVTAVSALPVFKGRWELPIAALQRVGIPIVSQQDCSDQACGLEITEATLREHPDLRVVVGLNDDAALGAQRAFINAGVDLSTVYIAGQDGSPEGLDAVKNGGAYKLSAAIQVKDLAQSIVQNSINAVQGSGPTDSETPVVAATLDDPGTLNSLIAQFQ